MILLKALLFASFIHDCPSQYDSLLQRDVYSYVDQPAEYPGGTPEMMKFITRNYKLSTDDYTLTVIARLVIDVDGTVISAQVVDKDEAEYTESEKELLRVYRAMPKWNAGKCDGKSVPVLVKMPNRIHFSR